MPKGDSHAEEAKGAWVSSYSPWEPMWIAGMMQRTSLLVPAGHSIGETRATVADQSRVAFCKRCDRMEADGCAGGSHIRVLLDFQARRKDLRLRAARRKGPRKHRRRGASVFGLRPGEG